MEMWQSGLLHFPAKEEGVKAPQVQILSSPLLEGKRTVSSSIGSRVRV